MIAFMSYAPTVPEGFRYWVSVYSIPDIRCDLFLTLCVTKKYNVNYEACTLEGNIVGIQELLWNQYCRITQIITYFQWKSQLLNEDNIVKKFFDNLNKKSTTLLWLQGCYITGYTTREYAIHTYNCKYVNIALEYYTSVCGGDLLENNYCMSLFANETITCSG